jgi:hypothetical protein
MSVDTVRDELGKMLPIYEMIQDAISGESAIKAKREKYLPVPNSSDTEAENLKRYNAYLLRAVYYNVISPTRDALVGQIFLRPPLVELPDSLKALEENINGEGLSLELLVKMAANHVLPYGRGGFLADFPTSESEITLADIKEGKYLPFIQFYSPWSIINWRVEKVGNRKKLTFLVLVENVEELKGEYKVEIEERHRVYRLIDNQCTVEVHYKGTKELFTIKDSAGVPLTYIPFEFIGSENNDSDIDEPPFYDLARLNIGHFRNSADYEESVFLVGQPTPVVTGLTREWVDSYFSKGIMFGSRTCLTLPENSDAKLLQALPNTLAFEAMTHKEDQMISIGAKIVNAKRNVERKQAEIEIEAASQTAVLTTIKNNLQQALRNCMGYACDFVGASKEEIKIELNDNFDLTSMTAEELRYLMELYVLNGITFSEFRENLRRSGIAKLKDDEAKKEIMEDQKMKKELNPVEPKADNSNTQTQENN